jgi:DNA-binding transcriptional MerR regulator
MPRQAAGSRPVRAAAAGVPPPPAEDPNPLGASDCARRTGVTVKALRVYERNGLIKPARSPSGWRLYGPKELVRLNAIVALKGLGLSLRQIQKSLDAAPVELPRVLRIQLDTWRARKEAAHRAIGLVEAALARLSARQSLSVDDLCELARSIDMKSVLALSREILNETFTPDEEREWSTYFSRMSDEEISANRDQLQASRALLREINSLMEQKVDPGSAEVQRLLASMNANLTQSRAREKALERLDWNPVLARKAHSYGSQLMMRIAVEGEQTEDGRLGEYLEAARIASTWGKALQALYGEAKALNEKGERPDSAAAQVVAKRFAQVCRDGGLGDPVVYARWVGEFGQLRLGAKWVPQQEAVREVNWWVAEALQGLPGV